MVASKCIFELGTNTPFLLLSNWQLSCSYELLHFVLQFCQLPLLHLLNLSYCLQAKQSKTKLQINQSKLQSHSQHVYVQIICKKLQINSFPQFCFSSSHKIPKYPKISSNFLGDGGKKNQSERERESKYPLSLCSGISDLLLCFLMSMSFDSHSLLFGI